MFPVVRAGARWCVTPSVYHECCELAEKRYLANRRGGVGDQRFSQRSCLDIELQGLLGEKAFIHLFQCNDDTRNTACRNAANDSFDARIASFTIDVKTTCAVGNGILAMASKRKNPPALFALMYLHGSVHWMPPAAVNKLAAPKIDAEFVGMIPSETLFQDHFFTVDRFGSKPAYYAPVQYLKALHDVEWTDHWDAPWLPDAQ